MKKAVLVVLDGCGLARAGKGNALKQARTPFMDSLLKKYPHTQLQAAGKAVGLLPGYIGNSEVGHLHLGAGRLVKQDLVRIFDDIKAKKFFRNKVLVKAMKRGTVHLLGLVSDAGVHSHLGHLFALIKMAHRCKVQQVYVHAITDGRDTPPKSTAKYLQQVERELAKYNKQWKIATVMGRYYAMDRDNRWNREHKAYAAMVHAKGRQHASWRDAVQEAYTRGETDEFIIPSVIGSAGTVKPGDAVVFFNFRSDRARELTRAFVQGRFNKFKRKKIINLYFACLTQYDPAIKAPVAYPPVRIKDTLGEVLAKNKLKQFRLAETEKWAHVTYFFNGLSGRIFNNEDRLLIPSPNIKTYDQQPAMKAVQITRAAKKALQKGTYAFVLINYANLDMVGHTGRLRKTVTAAQVVDRCLKELAAYAQKQGYAVVITADHGNAEQMLYPDGSVCTAHTTNKVPCIVINEQKLKLRSGALYNIAPTILQLLGIKKPAVMSKSLIR